MAAGRNLVGTQLELWESLVVLLEEECITILNLLPQLLADFEVLLSAPARIFLAWRSRELSSHLRLFASDSRPMTQSGPVHLVDSRFCVVRTHTQKKQSHSMKYFPICY